MRRLWRRATASWWASPSRSLAAVLSVALGVGTIAVLTTFYETTRRAITDEVVSRWLGAAHISVHAPGAHWGSMDAGLSDKLADLAGVRHVTGRLRRRVHLIPHREADDLIETRWVRADAIGIDINRERDFRKFPGLQGRLFRSDERGVVLIEQAVATAWKVSVGEPVVLTPYGGGPRLTLTVVGTFATSRVSEFQGSSVFLPLADLQEWLKTPNVVSAIDVMLDDTSPEAIAAAKVDVERSIVELSPPYPYRVETAEVRQMVLREAERVTRLLLLLIAFIAMLTSFFIIIATQSVSLMLRRSELGIMRCLGLTRRQLTALLLMELMPLGLVGTIAGLLGGIAVSYLVASVAMDGLVRIHLSTWGLCLAASAGMITTLVSALLLIAQVGGVTPMAATKPDAHAPRMRTIYLAGVAGVGLLLLHQWMTFSAERTRWLGEVFATMGAGSLHFGHALLAPTVVVLLGRPTSRVVGRVLGLRASLAEDAFVRAPWRSTGACWVLMVGLSMIVYTAVRAEGVLAIWDFPARLPSTFVWSPDYVPGATIEKVEQIPGVKKTTVSTDVLCRIQKVDAPALPLAKSLIERFLRKLTKPVFVAGDPDELLSMMKVSFVQGSYDEGMAKIRRGGHVLIPTQTARNQDLAVGDRVRVTIGRRSAEFEVAGVIQAPALDLAVTAFQAETYMQFAASAALLGTRDDLREKFDLDVVSMFMCDIDLPPASVPPGFDMGSLPDPTSEESVARALLHWAPFLPNEADTMSWLAPTLTTWLAAGTNTPLPSASRGELKRFAKAIQTLRRTTEAVPRTAAENWSDFRERLVLLRVAQVMDRPGAILGSLTRLKQQVDTSLRRAIVVMTWLPAVMLVIASIGIANLMMVSVHLRSRQIAVLRAVGALKSQIIRLVLTEAATLGLLGSVMGVALGLHEAYSVNHIAAGLIDVSLEYVVPVKSILLAVVLTVGVCVLAGIGPARYAARNNIIAAMQTN